VRRRNESGQAVVLLVLFMLGLLGMCALVMDVGLWYQARRSVQASADAAALAGASQLPAGWTAAESTAAAMYARNGRPEDGVTIVRARRGIADDSVVVTAERSVPSFFAGLLGPDRVTVRARARATLRSYTRSGPGDSVMPWGIMRDQFVAGATYGIYTDGSSPNNGALSLPIGSGGDCPGTTGASDYRDTIAGDQHACPVSIGQVVEPKTGQNAGPTRQGVGDRIPTYHPVSEIVDLADGRPARLLDEASPQLVKIPIIENVDGTTIWPNGSGSVRVVGFAWFVITAVRENGRRVEGVFVRAQTSGANATGDWDPASSIYTVMLTE
jgi:hypothetical protein